MNFWCSCSVSTSKFSVVIVWLFKDNVQCIVISDNLIVNYPRNSLIFIYIVHKMFPVFTKKEITPPCIIDALV